MKYYDSFSDRINYKNLTKKRFGDIYIDLSGLGIEDIDDEYESSKYI